jgi:hypothetical protein
MFKRIWQYFINNDNEYIFYKRFYSVFYELLNFKYKQMIYAGEGTTLPNEKGYILDFSKSSMFCYNDPIEIIVLRTKRNIFKPMNCIEKQLLTSIENLIIKTEVEERNIKYSQFSGLVNARDYDWETLENYGNNSHIQINTEVEYEHYIDETKPLIKGAIHHTWTDRYYFCINDGSHRLAAINRYAIKHNKKTEIRVKVDERKLNVEHGKIINENFIGIITTDETYSFLVNLLKNNNISILLEKPTSKKNGNSILWLKKSQDNLLTEIVNFINLLHYDRCYIISNIL